MDRRSFIRNLGLGLALGAAACKREGGRAALASQGQPSRVAVFTDPAVRQKEGFDPVRVGELLRRAISAACGSADAVSGIRKVVGDGRVVGVKLNCLAGQPLSPARETVDALAGLLEQAGVLPGNIVFFERAERDIRKGGFEVKTAGPGPLFLGHDSPGCGYQEQPSISGQVGSCLSRIVTERIDVLINLGVLKDHNLAGLGAGMKNLFGIIHNPNKYHDGGCDPYVADVLAFPVVQSKLRLTIIDALTAQCQGGPGYLPAHAWAYNGLLVSTDAVALDRAAQELIDEQRRKKKLPTLKEAGREPRWIRTAAARGLGTGDLDKIELLREG